MDNKAIALSLQTIALALRTIADSLVMVANQINARATLPEFKDMPEWQRDLGDAFPRPAKPTITPRARIIRRP